MPTYEYRCANGHDFEEFYLKMSAAQSELPCPTCGARGERRMSAGGGLLFKGSGFYITDYGKDGKKAAATSRTSANRGEGAGGDGAKGDGAKGDGTTGDRANRDGARGDSASRDAASRDHAKGEGSKGDGAKAGAAASDAGKSASARADSARSGSGTSESKPAGVPKPSPSKGGE